MCRFVFKKILLLKYFHAFYSNLVNEIFTAFNIDFVFYRKKFASHFVRKIQIRRIRRSMDDGRSMSVFSLYWQLSLGRMANFPAFIASKSFDLWNHHIPQMKWYNFWHILKYQKLMKFYKNTLYFYRLRNVFNYVLLH